MRRFIRLALAAAVVGPSPVLAQAGTPWDMKEWPIERGGRSRDPYVAPDGKVFFAGQQGNYVGMVDPATGAVKTMVSTPGFDPNGAADPENLQQKKQGRGEGK